MALISKTIVRRVPKNAVTNNYVLAKSLRLSVSRHYYIEIGNTTFGHCIFANLHMTIQKISIVTKNSIG